MTWVIPGVARVICIADPESQRNLDDSRTDCRQSSGTTTLNPVGRLYYNASTMSLRAPHRWTREVGEGLEAAQAGENWRSPRVIRDGGFTQIWKGDGGAVQHGP